MAKCEICGKTVHSGMSVSHSHIRTKRQWKPNLQTVHAVVDGTPSRQQPISDSRSLKGLRWSPFLLACKQNFQANSCRSPQ